MQCRTVYGHYGRHMHGVPVRIGGAAVPASAVTVGDRGDGAWNAGNAVLLAVARD